MIRTELDSMPAELDEISRRVLQLEIEETALKQEKDKASKDRLEVLRKDLGNARDKMETIKRQWEGERKGIDDARVLREQIEATRAEMERAERAYDLSLVAELKHGKLPDLEAELEKLENADKKDDSILKEEVTAEEIAEIVARWTGVPVTKLIEGEREKILRLQSILHERVIGQEEAVDAVAEAIMRARPESRILTVRSDPSFSSGRRELEKPSWPKPSLKPCSTAKATSFASTCPSTWRSTPWPAFSAPPRLRRV